VRTHRAALFVATLLAPAVAAGQDFTYEPPGVLVSGSGSGRVDDNVYVPGMRFPVEVAPAYPNSQVWGVGGSRGTSGSQCDGRNYSYPWHDNFCESRSWTMPLCPSGNGHQGQDIRPSTCDDATHWAVAAEDGVVTGIGTYAVYMMADAGTRHRYLHMRRSSIPVGEGDRVARGDRMGRISNEFGGTSTTIHLHYDLYQNVSGVGGAYVPTYLSLVESYEDLLGVPAEPCFVLPAEGGTLDDDGPCFRQYGPPDYWRRIEGMGHGGGMRWTNAWDGDRPGNWARWQVHTAAAGSYLVEVHVVEPYNRSKEVPYRVRHAGADTDVVVDQSSAAGWIALGTFDFAEGGDQSIEVYDNTGETASELHITADAVRFLPFVAAPDAGVRITGRPAAAHVASVAAASGGAGGSMESGCACRTAARGTGGWPLGAAMLLLVIRRRVSSRRT
jgi:murein DD-endopeptidase MepM/ murein hydrolase activator NlpD